MSALVESSDNNIKAIGGALTDAAPGWAQMRGQARIGQIAPEMDQTEALLEAVRVVDRARRARRNVAEFVGQGDMLTGGDSISTMGKDFLALFFRNVEQWTGAVGRNKIADALIYYTTEAEKTSPGADMFGETADPTSVVRAAKERQYGEQQQQGFFGEAGSGDGPSFRQDRAGQGPDGRGTDGGTAARGEDAEAGAGDPGRQDRGLTDPGVTRLSDLDEQDARNLDKRLRSGQAIRDLGDLMERAARNHAELQSEIAAAAKEAGAKAKTAPLKRRERVEEKVKVKYRGQLNRITDVARGGITAPTPAAAEAFVEAMGRRYPVLDEGWNVLEDGYFDRKLTVVFDDGQLGEVQIWAPGVLEAKEPRGTELYNIARDTSRPESKRAIAREETKKLFSGVLARLPGEWGPFLRQFNEGMDAFSQDRRFSNSSRDISGDLKSASTSRGSISPQELSSSERSSMRPGSGSTAGMERSTRKNRIGEPPIENVGADVRGVNGPADRLAAAKDAFNALDANREIPDIEAYLAAASELSAAREAFADDLAAKGGRVELRNSGDVGAIVTPMGDGYQITYFNPTGITGDTRQASLEAAVRDAVDQGYDTPAPGYLRELRKVDRWHSGVFR